MLMTTQGNPPTPHTAIVVMGVCGCGKSTVAQLIADKLGGEFYDGDHFHPQANIDKMASGTPLNDQDRQGWLETLRDLITEKSATTIPVIACSALKKQYRDLLRGTPTTLHFVHLAGSRDLLLERLNIRAANSNHFMPSTLLDSQLDTLEDPAGEPLTHTLDISLSPDQLATHVSTLFPKDI